MPITQRKKIVVCLGDSTTGGSSTSTLQYPEKLRNLLGYDWECVNAGVGGETASQIATRWTNQTRNKYTSNYARWLVLMGGINDIAAGTSAATTYAALKAIPDQAVSDGNWTGIIWMTTAPAWGYASLSAGEQTALLSLNTSISGYTGSNVTIYNTYGLLEDVATTGQLSYLGGTKPDYATSSVSPFGRDYLHYNNAAHSAIATALEAIISP